MPNFSTDADLLAYEPNVFVELPFASQRRLYVTDGSLSGATLTSETGGLSVLSVGNVVVLAADPLRWADAAGYAVVEIVDDQTLTLDVAPVGLPATGLTISGRTFSPQAALVHDELLRAIGIDPDDVDAKIDESSIASRGLMRRLESLGTLSRVYAAAIAISGDSTPITQKAGQYQRRFASALSSAQILIDTDGDGRADLWRSPGLARLIRV